jgi:hypothetical protein
MLINL